MGYSYLPTIGRSFALNGSKNAMALKSALANGDKFGGPTCAIAESLIFFSEATYEIQLIP